MRNEKIILIKILGLVFLIGIIYQNLQFSQSLEHYSEPNLFETSKETSKDWVEIQNRVQSLISDQSRLIERLNREMSLRESNGIEFDDSQTQDTSSPNELHTQPNIKDQEFTSYEQTWADYESEDLDFLNYEILNEQLRRFEESLTPTGVQELDNRIYVLTKQYQKGNVPGLEEIMSNINFDFLTTDTNTLSPRSLKYRNEIMESFKQTSLMKMHDEYTGR